MSNFLCNIKVLAKVDDVLIKAAHIRTNTKRYCKFRNFRENFIFANSVKRHICDVIKLRLGHD